MSNQQYPSIPSKDQRRSQINLLTYMEKEQRDSKEFLFPEDNLLHRRRQSADPSASQSEDDESATFKVQ